MKALQTVAVATLIIVGAAAPAVATAEPATVRTETFTDTFEIQGPLLFCTPGPLYQITDTFTVVDHIVEPKGGDGSVHDSSTSTETFTATPVDDPSLPTATGEATGHGTFQRDRIGAATSTTTGVRTVMYSDGTRVSERQVSHFTVTPDGHLNVSFSKCAGHG